MLKNILLICVIALLACSCLTNKAQRGGTGGAAGGAILGQIIGGDTESTLIGAALGGMLGYVIGNEMDKNDQEQLNTVYETTPSYDTTEWINPDTGNKYAVTPQPAYTDKTSNQACRKAEIEATIDGKKEITEAVACRQNGKWAIQQQ